jgi:hypothetical protein
VRLCAKTGQSNQTRSRGKPETPWDGVHVAYFSGKAMWTYLNIRFLYALPGFETEEIASIQPGGESWRRLRVAFPIRVRGHTRTQISCFGPGRPSGDRVTLIAGEEIAGHCPLLHSLYENERCTRRDRRRDS